VAIQVLPGFLGMAMNDDQSRLDNSPKEESKDTPILAASWRGRREGIRTQWPGHSFSCPSQEDS
jgi:hypothetical protein